MMGLNDMSGQQPPELRVNTNYPDVATLLSRRLPPTVNIDPNAFPSSGPYAPYYSALRQLFLSPIVRSSASLGGNLVITDWENLPIDVTCALTCAPKLPPFSGRVSNNYGDYYEAITVY